MRTRQCGAAHVNVFFFLVMLVLFLGATVFAYVTLDRNTSLQEGIRVANAEAAAAEGQLLLYRHYTEDLAQEIGEAGEYAGRAGFNYETYGNPAPLQNVPVPTRVEQTMAEFARMIGVPEASGLANLFSHIKNAVDTKDQTIVALRDNETSLKSEITALKSSLDEAKTAAQTRERDLNQQLRTKDEEYGQSITDSTSRLTAANTEYGRLREQRSSEAEQHAQVVMELRRNIDTLQAQLDVMRNKTQLINPADQPDGMVLDASQSTGLAWVNLGRRDMLPVGTTFEIMSPNSSEVKAYGTVRRVEPTQAELVITGLKDRYDPVMPGDRVRNDLYSPELKHNIYLMGRFNHPYSRESVKTLLENLGNRVVSKLSPGVDLIILGQDTVNEDRSGFTPIEETEEYQKAQFLRIEIVPLSKVQNYLKLSGELTSAR